VNAGRSSFASRYDHDVDTLRRDPPLQICRCRWVVLVGLLSFCLATIACSSRDSGPTRVVLVSIDTLRADHVGFMGSKLGATPQLDALAQRGTVFQTTISPAPLTLPSHTTLLTGLDPPSHGIHHNGLFSLDQEIPTLADHAHKAGLTTGAFIGAVVLDRRYGIGQGFDHYDDEIGDDVQLGGAFTERAADVVIDRAIDWIRRTEGRFFSWIHLYDPHLPWTAPAAFRKRFADPYLAEIAYTDAQVGRLVEAVEGLWPDERTLWIVTSDHGESLGEHGERSHAYTIYEATQRVPLMIVGPGVPTGQRVDTLARLSDVTPTILARIGVAPIANLDGRDLLDSAPPADSMLPAYSETRATEYDHGWSSLYSIRNERFHFIRAVEPELYDLEGDPNEIQNLASSQPGRVLELDAALEGVLSHARRTSAADELSATEQRQLAALGYLPNPRAVVRDLGQTGGLSPRDGLLQSSRWMRGRQLLENGRSRAAVEILCGLPSSSPLVSLDCSRAALSTGDLALAEARARSTLNAHPDAERVLADVLFGKGEYDDAEILYKRMTANQPDSGALLVALGHIAAAQGGPDRALELYRRATMMRLPSNEGLLMGSALLFRQRRIGEARQLFAQIDARDITRPNAAAELVSALQAAGDVAGARRLLLRALKIYPDADALERLLAPELALATSEHEWIRGRRLLELGKPDHAYRVLERADVGDPLIDLDRAWAAARSGRTREAQALARRAGAHQWAGVTLAEALIRDGEWDAAELLIEELQTKGLAFPNLKTMLGRIAEGRGQLDRAIAIYREAGNADAPAQEALWRWAALEIEAGRPDVAKGAMARFHLIDPYANARLVEAELVAGSIERAQQRLLDALTRHPDAEALLALEARLAGTTRNQQPYSTSSHAIGLPNP
jgi:choline-sulfatase